MISSVISSKRNNLRSIPWRVGYSSDEIDLVSAFYEPAMRAAVQYDRAVGYFSSLALAVIAKGIGELYLNNGKMRLIASPALSSEDIEAIRLGHLDRSKIIPSRLLEYLNNRRLGEEENLRLQLLSGMLADGLLELRLAVREHQDGSLGLFHEKIGVFVDHAGDFVSFIGSPNESWNGWVGNAESFALHTSWGPASEYAVHERGLFEKTWDGKRLGVPVRDFPDAVRDEIFRLYPPREPTSLGVPQRKSRATRSKVELPVWLTREGGLRIYQRDAVNAWLASGARGVFAMATGTGKTICALAAATQLWNALKHSKESLLVVVAVPSRDLVAQWSEAAQSFGFSPVECHSETATRWPTEFSNMSALLQFASPEVGLIISTADTLSSARFQGLMNEHSGRLLFIADEMHSLGTQRRLQSIPEADFRLGLSATPRRHGDEEGTAALLDYFGEILISIDINQAIELEALVPYSYHPIIIRLTNDELKKYRELSAKIAAMIGGSLDSEESLGAAEYLLFERARLLGHAEEKIPALREIMKPRRDSFFNLVYVAEGNHPITGDNQLDQTINVLGKELTMAVNTYTSETPAAERHTLQQMLRQKQLQALVAMRCLDEGIDIPEAQCGIILASTQNPRQFVQRRGRILRKCDRINKKSAQLFDLLVLPNEPPSRADASYRLERRLVGRELTRALELASASSNGHDTPPPEIRAIMGEYELLEMVASYGQEDHWCSGGKNEY